MLASVMRVNPKAGVRRPGDHVRAGRDPILRPWSRTAAAVLSRAPDPSEIVTSGSYPPFARESTPLRFPDPFASVRKGHCALVSVPVSGTTGRGAHGLPAGIGRC